MSSTDKRPSSARTHRLVGSGEPTAPGSSEPPIRVRDTGELVASVPALIGFHPRESLVMIAMGGRSGRRIGLALRVDLPPPRHRDAVVADAVRGLLLDGPSGAVVIVLGGRSGRGAGPPGGDLPHADLVSSVVTALGRHGVDAHASIWAESTSAGAPWACYDPCRCSGVLPDPATTAFAASVVASGQVIHRDRAALDQLVAPADPARIRRREEMLIARLDEAVRRPEATAEGPRAGLALVDAAIVAAAEGGPDLDDNAVVDLACALSDTEVRDAALLRNTGPTAAAAEQLWTVLVRETPDPEAAEPAAMLAVSALLRGDGALANVALERAAQAWPGHRLTGLLRVAADVGMRPDQVRSWLIGPAPSGLRTGPVRRIR